KGVFDEKFAKDLTIFFTTFSGIFGSLNRDVSSMRQFLSQPDVAFLLVTSPAPAALLEALFFENKTRELGLPFRGFVLNKSRGCENGKVAPTEDLLPKDASPEARSALRKLALLAKDEQEHAERDKTLLSDLVKRA